MQEKRSYNRVVLDLSINFKVKGKDSQAFKGYISNLSASGLGMTLAEDSGVEVGSIIEFEVSIPYAGRPLAGSAEVRRVVKTEKNGAFNFKVGVKFIDANKDLVMFIMKRHQERLAEKMRLKKKVKPLDLPY